MATTTASTAIAAPTEASSAPIYIDTQHEDLVHDAQMDYYGAKLATCSSGKNESVCILGTCCVG
jgi:protein transport protein SEC13